MHRKRCSTIIICQFPTAAYWYWSILYAPAWSYPASLIVASILVYIMVTLGIFSIWSWLTDSLPIFYRPVLHGPMQRESLRVWSSEAPSDTRQGYYFTIQFWDNVLGKLWILTISRQPANSVPCTQRFEFSQYFLHCFDGFTMTFRINKQLTIYSRNTDVLQPSHQLLRCLRRRFHHKISHCPRNWLRHPMCTEIYGRKWKNWSKIPGATGTDDESTSWVEINLGHGTAIWILGGWMKIGGLYDRYLFDDDPCQKGDWCEYKCPHIRW